MPYVVNPDTVEKWPLEKHVGVTSKLLADGDNMTVLWSRWEPNASAPEHVHPHEQIGFCLEGEMVFTINGKDYTIHAGEYYRIPPSAPHAERNDSRKAAVLTDFFSPARSDLLQRRFNPEIVGNTTKESSPKGGER